MKNIVLLSYGKETEYKRAIFCILSFWKWYGNSSDQIRVVIYTDNIDYFKSFLTDFDVLYRPTTISEINDFIRETGYMYRFKISVIDQTFVEYPNDDLLFIDTDTFFITNPKPLLDAIIPGQCFMHEREYSFEEGIDVWRMMNTKHTADADKLEKYPKSFIALIESKTFSIAGKEVKFNRNDHVWNSGVLGISKEVFTYIPDVFALTDEFFLKTRWRISEQIAFTFVLKSFSKVLPASQYLNHYWYYKDRVDIRLNELFTDNFKKLNKTDKILVVGKLIKRLNKRLHHEQMMTDTIVALRKKNFKEGIKNTFKAVTSLPLNADFIEIIKYRLGQKIS